MNRHLLAASAAAKAVEARADELNRLDACAGDGDLGVTMRQAATAVLEALPALDGQTSAQVLTGLGSAIARRAPSTCGTLVATGMLSAARVADESPTSDARAVANLLRAACEGISRRGGASPGSKTMIDALAPAAAAAGDAADNAAGLEPALEAAATAADAGAQATVTMRARHGRAGWLAERSTGHEDPGARLIAIILRAYADALHSN